MNGGTVTERETPAAAPRPGLPAPRAPAATWLLRGIFALMLVFALREAQHLLTPVMVAVVLTFVLAPAVRWLRRWGVAEALGAAIVVGALVAGTGLLATSLAQPAAQWVERAPATVAQLLAGFDRLRARIPGLAPPAATGATAAPASSIRAPSRVAASPPPDAVKDRLASEGLALTGALLSRSVSFAVALAATIILLYFLLASEHWMLSRLVEALPRRRTRALVLAAVRAAQREIGHYLVAVGCINVCAGIATALALWALDVPNPTLWGALVALLSFVPYLGPLVTMGLLLLAGFTSEGGPAGMLAPVGVYAAIHAIESNFVSPWVLGRRLSLSPISVLLSVMVWGWLWGIAGALIAVPLLIAVHAACLRARGLRRFAHFLEGDKRTPPSLRSLLATRRRPVWRGRPRPPPVSTDRAGDAAPVGPAAAPLQQRSPAA